jgi:peptidase E
MSTKYILNSGGIRNNLEGGKRFFAECVKGLSKTPKVLICLFAYPREHWEEKFEDLITQNLYPEGVNPIFELAFPKIFEEQIKNTDIIYIYGGDDYLLQYWLLKFDIPKIWEGKVVAASSAGSNALVQHFWTCDWRDCMDGFGILPIKFLPHYKSDFGSDDPRGPIDWEKAYKELEAYGDKSLPIHALREGEFIVIEK